MAPKCQLCHRISPVQFNLCLLRRTISPSLLTLLLFNHVRQVQPPLHIVVHLHLLGCDVPRVLDDHDNHEVKRARTARSAVPAQLNGIPGSNLLQGAHSTVQDNTTTCLGSHHNTTQHITAQHCIAQHNTTHENRAQHNTTQNSTTAL